MEDIELQQYLPKMTDYAVFIQLNQIQVKLYNDFSDIVKSTEQTTESKKLLVEFGIFKYICTHPQMLPFAEKQRKKKNKEKDVITNYKDSIPSISTYGWWKSKLPSDSGQKIEYGTKLVVLKAIIEECEVVGDKL